jgi:hypothetical protein
MEPMREKQKGDLEQKRTVDIDQEEYIDLSTKEGQDYFDLISE